MGKLRILQLSRSFSFSRNLSFLFLKLTSGILTVSSFHWTGKSKGGNSINLSDKYQIQRKDTWTTTVREIWNVKRWNWLHHIIFQILGPFFVSFVYNTYMYFYLNMWFDFFFLRIKMNMNCNLNRLRLRNTNWIVGGTKYIKWAE